MLTKNLFKINITKLSFDKLLKNYYKELMNGMTGYSFKELYSDNIFISSEIKSVNHRFLEINILIPSYLNNLEIKIRDLIQKYIKRGKIDIVINFKSNDRDYDIELDLDLATQYVDNLKKLIENFNLKDEVKLFHLTRYEEIFLKNKRKDYSKYWEIIEKLLIENINEINEMRKKEGESTKKDLIKIISEIIKEIELLKKYVPDMEKEIFNNIKNKVIDLIGDKIDENRIALESSILVSKSCINEEIERLKYYTEQFLKIIDEDNDVGKRLDFLCQEMHREINTIGSKITKQELTGNVISIKNNIEKIREQIRNIE